MIRWLMLVAAALALTACDYDEVERETGYKGKARINPWLAAERFEERMDRRVKSVLVWTPPDVGDAVWIMPASVLGNESFTRRTEQWVRDGGHLILLVEHADGGTNDWSEYESRPELQPALFSMLKRAGITLEEGAVGAKTKEDKIKFKGRNFKVNAESQATAAGKNGKAGVFASVKSGQGRVTVLTDGRVFRNRWIGDNDHAALLDALVEVTGYDGMVGFMRGSGLSLWGLLMENLRPVLLALGVLLLLWLWKNMARFGPLEAASTPSVLRGYDHHLEALGDFQWRFDRAASLLVPLREQIVELGQKTSVRAGRRDDDFFQFLADRAEISRERAFRALAEAAPADPAVLTRTTADLQKMLSVLNSPFHS